MTTPWRDFIDVQAVDTQIAQVEHRADTLPEREQLADVEGRLAALTARSEGADSRKRSITKDQRRIEDEVASLEAKVAEEEAKLYGAGGSDVKQLQALQDEIASLRRRIDHLEDEELELLVELEPVDAELAELARERDALDDEARAVTVRLAELEAEIDAERDRLLAERAALVESIDADALATYDSVRNRLGGVAVARLDVAGVCGACHMKLSAVEHDRIKHLAADEPVQCEDCGRYLVRD